MTENMLPGSRPQNGAASAADSNGPLSQAPDAPTAYGKQMYEAPQRSPAGQYASHGTLQPSSAAHPALPEAKASGRQKAAAIMAIILGVLLLVPALVMLEDSDLGFMAFLIFLAALGNITVGILMLVKLGAQTGWAPVTLIIATASVVMLGIVGPMLGLFNLALLMLSLPLTVPIGILLGLELAKQKRRAASPGSPYSSGLSLRQPQLYAQSQREQAAGAGHTAEHDSSAQPQYLQHPAPPVLPEMHAGRKRPNRRGIGSSGKIVLAATAAAVLVVGGYLLLPSQNSDACKLYEAAVHELDDAVAMSQEGILSQADVRSAFKNLPSNIGLAVNRAHGDVLVEMQESFAYATAYQASPTEDNGMAYFLHQNQVAEACSAARSPIDVE